jgi:nitroreductase
MEFYEVLEKRHSVRDFSEKEIEQKKLQKVLEAAIKAPSAGNLQAYKIYAVRSSDAKKALVPAALYQEFLSGASVLLVFCADKEHSLAKYAERGAELYAVQDATIAAAYSQLAATAEGLSCVWVGAFDPLEVSRIVNAGPHEVPVAIISLGYAKGKALETGRRPIKEIVKEV